MLLLWEGGLMDVHAGPARSLAMHSGLRTAFRISSRTLNIKHIFPFSDCSGNMIVFHNLALPGENLQRAGGQARFVPAVLSCTLG